MSLIHFYFCLSSEKLSTMRNSKHTKIVAQIINMNKYGIALE